MPSPTRLKTTKAFAAIYRRGRWAKGELLSVGVIPNGLGSARVGLRTRRGLKGAVQRNRLKRQLRAIVAGAMPLRAGVDVAIVAGPKERSAPTASLERELRALCKRLAILS